MSEELKPCPFCGGEVSVVVLDDEGNIRDEEYERDPYSGLSYAVAHDDPNGACPIATYDEPLPWLYDSRDGVAHVWNRRAERTCRPVVADDGAGAWGVYCSECGYRFAGPHGKREVPEHMATRRDIMPCYCPSCGARVEVVGE